MLAFGIGEVMAQTPEDAEYAKSLNVIDGFHKVPNSHRYDWVVASRIKYSPERPRTSRGTRNRQEIISVVPRCTKSCFPVISRFPMNKSPLVARCCETRGGLFIISQGNLRNVAKQGGVYS